MRTKGRKAYICSELFKKTIMKKLFALLFVAAAFTFTSCGDASGNASDEATEEGTDATEEVVEEEVVVEVVEETTDATDAPAEEVTVEGTEM